MVDRLIFTILGCSSSPGVPRITGDWGACDPSNPKNRRTRAALMVRRVSDNGETVVVIDTGPDFRQQMIDNQVKRLDAVLYTHAHADHIHGIDDIRGFVMVQRHRIPIYADEPTMAHLRKAFGYCMETPVGSSYPPIVRPHLIADLDTPIVINGAGGPISFLPLEQIHGDIRSLGFRIGDVAYCPDVSDIPTATANRMQGLDTLIIDALQYKPHPSHLSIDQALMWIDRLQPRQAILTHMHIPLDYETVMHETPDHVQPAHDGLTFECEVQS